MRKQKAYIYFRYKGKDVRISEDIYDATKDDQLVLIKVDGVNTIVPKSELMKS